MPTCPGCNECVSYDRLATHQKYCGELFGHDCPAGRSLERLERRISAIESRLDDRASVGEEVRSEGSGLRFKKRDE